MILVRKSTCEEKSDVTGAEGGPEAGGRESALGKIGSCACCCCCIEIENEAQSASRGGRFCQALASSAAAGVGQPAGTRASLYSSSASSRQHRVQVIMALDTSSVRAFGAYRFTLIDGRHACLYANQDASFTALRSTLSIILNLRHITLKCPPPPLQTRLYILGL